MKKLINIVLLILLTSTVSSCLKMGLDDLESYDEAKIEKVYFEYRWWNEADNQLAVKTLTVTNSINEDENLVTCTLTVPAADESFTAAIRQEVSLNKLIAYIDVSTAARVTPLDGAPKLGTPGDFSAKEFKYLVTAADGTKREWTIKITDFIK